MTVETLTFGFMKMRGPEGSGGPCPSKRYCGLTYTFTSSFSGSCQKTKSKFMEELESHKIFKEEQCEALKGG